MISLYLITPFLGCLRNYVKYKQLDFLMFIRTPIIYFLLTLIFDHDNVFQTLIYERWLLFMYKTCLSLYRNDYINKKDKYIKKYGLKY